MTKLSASQQRRRSWRLTVNVSPAHAATLQRVQAATGEREVEIIERLIAQEASLQRIPLRIHDEPA